MLLAALFLLAALGSAQDLSSASRELARKIGRRDVTEITVRNTSELPDSAAGAVQRALEAELRPRARAGGSAVAVTLSENLQGYLWIAEVERGGEREIVFHGFPRRPAAERPASVTIERKLIWEQEIPILDTARAGSLLIVLEPAAVVFHHNGRLAASLPVTVAAPASRDPRGRLAVEGESFRAMLPGVLCTGTVNPAPAMSCAAATGGVVPGRNYFDEPPLPPYYTSAKLSDALRLIAATDGRARAYDAGGRELHSIGGWGSDIAAIDTGCGRRLLASGAGEPDAIQAYDVTASGAAAAGDPLTFAGPVTALWQSENPAEAVAVARHPESGRYAAYSLAIACSR
jgi:hypothetical protein